MQRVAQAGFPVFLEYLHKWPKDFQSWNFTKIMDKCRESWKNPMFQYKIPIFGSIVLPSLNRSKGVWTKVNKSDLKIDKNTLRIFLKPGKFLINHEILRPLKSANNAKGHGHQPPPPIPRVGAYEKNGCWSRIDSRLLCLFYPVPGSATVFHEQTKHSFL